MPRFCPGNRVALFLQGILKPTCGGVGGGGKWVGHAPGPVEAGTYAAEGGARTGPPWSTEESGEGAVVGWGGFSEYVDEKTHHVFFLGEWKQQEGRGIGML